jgi:hypothetical protein
MDENTPTLGHRWDPDAALLSLETSRTVKDVNIHDPLQLRESVNDMFRESAELVAMGVIHLALHEPSPKIRLEASKYVLDKATADAEGEADPLAKLVSDLYKQLDVKVENA